MLRNSFSALFSFSESDSSFEVSGSDPSQIEEFSEDVFEEDSEFVSEEESDEVLEEDSEEESQQVSDDTVDYEELSSEIISSEPVQVYSPQLDALVWIGIILIALVFITWIYRAFNRCFPDF